MYPHEIVLDSHNVYLFFFFLITAAVDVTHCRFETQVFLFYSFLQVIRTLDPKQNQGAAPEIQALKNQLQERDRQFHSLEVVYYNMIRHLIF